MDFKSQTKILCRQTGVYLAIYCLIFNLHIQAALAGPEGAQVVSGQVGFQQSGYNTTITASDKAIVNYSSFDIARPETVQFIQPSRNASVLNRILSANPTNINGTLLANGRVFFVNPAGVYIGNGARINVAQLVASSLNISNFDFINGQYNFAGDTGSVINSGDISAEKVYLIGKQVANFGNISCPAGYVVMASGDRVFLGEMGSDVVVEIDVPSLPEPVEPIKGSGVLNEGTVEVGDGTIILAAAGDIYSQAISNVGSLSASSDTGDAGQVKLTATDGTVINSGSIEAKSSSGTGGTVQMLGDKVGLFGTAEIDVSGSNGGGMVLVGGDYQGEGDIPTASRTYVSADSTIKADAIENGDGGKVVIWSDEITGFYGSTSARGGADGGDGGFVEVSGKDNLGFYGHVDTLAPQGDMGTLLLDPTDIFVSTYDGTDGANGGNILFADTPTAEPWNVTTAQLIAVGANLTLQAMDDITISGPVILTTNGAGITARAGNDIIVGAPIITYGGSIDLTANDSGGTQSGDGKIDLNAALDTTGNSQTGGAVTLTIEGGTGSIELNDDITTSTANITFEGPVLLTANVAISTTTGVAGTITFQSTLDGTTDFAEDLSLTAGAGNIDFDGIVGGTKDLGDVTIVSAADVTADAAFNADSLTQSAGTGTTQLGGVTTIAGGLSVSNANISIVADITAGTTLALTATADEAKISIPIGVDVESTGGAHTYTADKMDIDGTITANGQTVTLKAESTTDDDAIHLSSTVDTTANTLELSDTELDNITATTIVIGEAGQAGAITVVGEPDISPDNATNLHLISNSAVSASMGGFVIPNLAIEAAGSVMLTDSTTDVDTVAINTSAGSIQFDDADSFSVGTVDGVAGVSTDGGEVKLTAHAGDLTVTEDIGATSKVTLRAYGDERKLSIAAGAHVESTGGSHYYIADKMDIAGTITTATSEKAVLYPYESSDAIDVGSTTDFQINTLELSDAELDRITAAELRIGEEYKTGPITISANISPDNVTDVLRLKSDSTVTINGDIDTQTAGKNCGVKIRNTGLLDIAAGADMTLDGLFLKYGDGAVSTAGDITTTDDNITFQQAVTLTDSVAFSTGAGAGDITFESSLNGTTDFAEDLTLTAGAGNITIAETVGTTAKLGDIMILSAADVTFGSEFFADSLTQGTGTGTTQFGGVTTVAGGLSVSNANISIVADITAGTTLALTATADEAKISIPIGVDVESTGGAHTYTADKMDIAGTITATGRWVYLSPRNADPVDIGSAVDTTDNTLELSDTELDHITASVLRITSGLDAPLTVSADISPANITSFLDLVGYDSQFIINGKIDTLTAGKGCGLRLYTDQTVDIAPDADITLDGAFDYTQEGDTLTAGDITTTGDNITFSRNVQLTDGHAVAFSTGAGAGNITFTDYLTGTTDFAEDLTLTAGAGNITFNGAVGNIKDLGDITIVSAADVTAHAAFNANTLTQQAGTGDTQFDGAVTLNGAGGMQLTTNTVTINSTVSTGNGGIVTITNAGLLDIAAAADMTLDGAFTQNGAGAVQTAGNITTTGENITFGQAVTLGGDVDIDTSAGAGNITFQSTLDGTTALTENLTLAAGTGDITFSGIVGGGTALGDVTVNSADDFQIQTAFNTSNLVIIDSDTTIDIDDDVTAAGDIELNNSADVADGVTLTVGNDLKLGAGKTMTGEGDLTLVATAGGITEKAGDDDIFQINMAADDKTLTLTQNDALDMANFAVTNDEDTYLVANSTGSSVTSTAAGSWKSISASASGDLTLTNLGNNDTITIGNLTSGGEIWVQSIADLTAPAGATLTANGTYSTATDDRSRVYFQTDGDPIDVAIYLGSYDFTTQTGGNVTVNSAVSMTNNGTMVIDAYDTVNTFGSNFTGSAPWSNTTNRLEVVSRISQSLDDAINNNRLPHASEARGDLAPSWFGGQKYVLRGKEPLAEVLAAVESTPIASTVSVVSETSSSDPNNCSEVAMWSLLQWLTEELGEETVRRMYLVDAYVYSTDLRPYKVAARLMKLAAILEDANPTELLASAGVVGKFVGKPPSLEEQINPFKSALLKYHGDGTLYDRIEWLDALATYMSILNTEIGWSSERSIGFVMRKYCSELDTTSAMFLETYLRSLSG